MKRLRGRPFGNRQDPSCADVAQVLQTYLDKELDERDMPAVLRHLEKCKDCGLELSVYDELKSRLEQGQTPVPDEALKRLQAFGADIANKATQP